MKKFLLTLCASTPTVTPSLLTVKGIYTALFILILTTTASAQIELKDNTAAVPFYKWEVGLDLKPLFRSDEPYNVMAKWHFTERKALRFGLGTNNWSKTNDTLLIYEYLFDNNQRTDQYLQLAHLDDKKVNWDIKIGYQYQFKQGKISLYTATDLNWIKQTLDFSIPVQVVSGHKGTMPPFLGYQSVFFIYNRKTTYSLIQSLGFKYTINNFLSCSFETSLIGQYVEFVYDTAENPYVDVSYTKRNTKGGHGTYASFKPLMGLFLNYHF